MIVLRSGLAIAPLVLLASCATDNPPAPLPAPPPARAAEARPAGTSGPATLQIAGTARQGALLRGVAPGGTVGLTLDGKPVPFDPQGQFIIAFDRDASPSATLVATLANGDAQSRIFSVEPGNWRIERVNASITGSATTEEFRRLRAGELEQINAARTRQETSEGWRQHFIWPVQARISGIFGSQRIYRGTPGSYHSGLDLAGGAGTVYVAPADGVVVLAAETPFTLEGYLLMIDHGMGLNSAFLHSQKLLVKQGDAVKQGQPLGLIGATGRVSGPHLHWSLKWQDARIDPLPLLEPRSP